MESLTSQSFSLLCLKLLINQRIPPGRQGGTRRLLPMGLLAFTLTSGVITPIMGFREPLAEARDMTAPERKRSENRPSLLSSTPPYEAL